MPPTRPLPLAADPASTSTRSRLLDAAEALFAERGIAPASLRSIARRAGANLAAAHYHFGSKEGLVRAVFQRRIEPLNRERLELLAACEAAAGDRPPALGDILRAFVAPVFRVLADEGRGGQEFCRLMGRAAAEPDQEIRETLFGEFREVARRFTAALGRALPELPPEALTWRFHCAVGAVIHSVARGDLVAILAPRRSSAPAPEAVMDRVLEFLEGGMRAPAPPRPVRRPRRRAAAPRRRPRTPSSSASRALKEV